VKTRGLRDWNIHPRRGTGTKRIGYSRFKRKLLFLILPPTGIVAAQEISAVRMQLEIAGIRARSLP
jgi:hypothetical protein